MRQSRLGLCCAVLCCAVPQCCRPWSTMLQSRAKFVAANTRCRQWGFAAAIAAFLWGLLLSLARDSSCPRAVDLVLQGWLLAEAMAYESSLGTLFNIQHTTQQLTSCENEHALSPPRCSITQGRYSCQPIMWLQLPPGHSVLLCLTRRPLDVRGRSQSESLPVGSLASAASLPSTTHLNLERNI